VQILAGFWERLYPQVRRELMRRYPKALLAGAAVSYPIHGIARDEERLARRKPGTTDARSERVSSGGALDRDLFPLPFDQALPISRTSNFRTDQFA